MSVSVTTAEGVATITITRPERMNALDEPTRTALVEAIRGQGADERIGALVLTGSGRAFCAGQDLAAIHELDDAEDTVARTYNPIAAAIIDVPVPVIAAVNGAAVGAGMGIALACDVVVMSDRASLACVFGKVGLVPDTGTSWFLVRTLGYARAYDLATTGRKIDADEAFRLGLVTAVVPHDELHARAHARAVELAAGPRLSQSLTKRNLRAAMSESLTDSLAREASAQGDAARDDAHRELRAAFLDR